MKLVLASNGQIEYDLDEELFDLEVEAALVRLLSEPRVNDNALVSALMESPWELMQRCG